MCTLRHMHSQIGSDSNNPLQLASPSLTIKQCKLALLLLLHTSINSSSPKVMGEKNLRNFKFEDPLFSLELIMKKKYIDCN